MRKIRQCVLALIGVGLVALLAAACGSSGSSSSSGGGGGGGVSAAGPTSGPGLTEPTKGSGGRVAGGTVYFTEGPDATPNYIFPMYTFAVCSTTNVNQLMDMIYRPLYWYGNKYRPTIDYDYS